jgi:acetyl-CoA carboxylase biotin carboxylase subunit
MFSRILVANRGEIALRIIRACKELGVETVAVFSEADSEQPYLHLADETVCIGPANPTESYLNIPAIVSAAEVTDVEAIHPGYGFLAENSHFAEICESCRIGFIGPSSEVMAKMGNKTEARTLATEMGIPLLPGSQRSLQSDEEALETAHSIGFPVMIKAAGGGGGRGMRIAHNDMSLINCFIAARAEAEAAFKNSALYLEKYVEHGRHVEIQVLADKHGDIVYLGERDCSVQRRFQKLIEESPSPAVDEKLRREMGRAAVTLLKGAGYSNAGTVEFLLDEKKNFYFLEVNARVQVEHPVTEMVTGVDLVKEQIRIASGAPLSIKQRDVQLSGHSIECRINAEDPDDNFRPSPGRISSYYAPGGPGVRVDSHVCAGMEIACFYDSLISKLIVHMENRQEAITTMSRALQEYEIGGISTTIPLHLRVMSHRRFASGKADTAFLEHLVET